MTVYLWAAGVLAVCAGLWRAYAAGRQAEKLKCLREEVRSYEQMETVRRRVDGLSAGGLINILRGGGRKT